MYQVQVSNILNLYTGKLVADRQRCCKQGFIDMKIQWPMFNILMLLMSDRAKYIGLFYSTKPSSFLHYPLSSILEATRECS